MAAMKGNSWMEAIWEKQENISRDVFPICHFKKCHLSVYDPELVPERAPLPAVDVQLLEVDRVVAHLVLNSKKCIYVPEKIYLLAPYLFLLLFLFLFLLLLGCLRGSVRENLLGRAADSEDLK